MKIVFRVHVHTEDEIQIGHKLGFTGLEGVDAVSATANPEGFTPLTAAARIYGWDRDVITRASEQCNARREVAIVDQVTPTLLLVPKVTRKTSYELTVEGCAVTHPKDNALFAAQISGQFSVIVNFKSLADAKCLQEKLFQLDSFSEIKNVLAYKEKLLRDFGVDPAMLPMTLQQINEKIHEFASEARQKFFTHLAI